MRLVVKHERIDFKGQALYLKDEQSFFYDPWNDVDFSILIAYGYNSLDINLNSGRVLQMTGLNPSCKWISKELTAPVYQQGILVVSFDEKKQAGTGMQYANNWETYFDCKTGWVCIGDPQYSRTSDSVEFAKNTIAVIDDGQLSSIWIKPLFV